MPAILEEQRFQDFAALYRLLHRSRCRAEWRTPATACWNNTMPGRSSRAGASASTCATASRNALIRLANGFLHHPANEELRRRARTACTGNERIAADNLYRQLFRVWFTASCSCSCRKTGAFSAPIRSIATTTASPACAALLDQRAAYHRS